MDEKEHKIFPYEGYGRILIILFLLTAATISVTSIDLATWSVIIALLIACVKGGIVMLYFMHLKFENLLLRILAFGVVALLAVVIILTFFDYLYR
jgi:cytochrome c oxidase subunit IV